MVSARLLFSVGKQILEEKEVENAGFDASFILKKHCGLAKSDLIIKDTPLTSTQEKAFLEDIKKRAENIPLQYILGEWEFMSLPFAVNEHVLIPRADTECLVEAVLRLCKGKKELKCLDLCTGSGCIAVSLTYYNKDIFCYGADISFKALEIAQKNAIQNKVQERTDFLKLNVLQGEKDGFKEEKVDIIVSNPPYIKREDIKTLSKEVKDHEPLLALDGGESGMIFYEAIIENYKATLKKGGHLCFECGIGQAIHIKEMMKAKGFYEIEIIKDLSGIERVIIGNVN